MKIYGTSTVLAPIAWGTTYLTVTGLLPGQGPLLVAAGRVTPAGVVLLAVARRVGWWRPAGREWSRVGALALANFAVFFPLLTVAVQRLPGGVAAAAGGVQPLLVAALAWPVLGTRPPPKVLAVGGLAAVGVALVMIRPGATLDAIGITAALGANLSFAVGVVLTRRWGVAPHRIAAAGWQLLVAAVFLVPLAVAVDGPPQSLTVANIVGFAYLSLVATAAAFVVWFQGIARLPIVAPPLLGLAAPVTGAALGWLVLGQSMSAVQLVGFALTLAAIAHGATTATRSRPTRASALGGCLGARQRQGLGEVVVLPAWVSWHAAARKRTSRLRTHASREGHPRGRQVRPSP